jgi:hypothetical protein
MQLVRELKPYQNALFAQKVSIAILEHKKPVLKAHIQTELK